MSNCVCAGYTHCTFLARNTAANSGAGEGTDFTAASVKLLWVGAYVREGGYVICDMMKFRVQLHQNTFFKNRRHDDLCLFLSGGEG